MWTLLSFASSIVFVHGLNGHREKTWTTEGSSPWPQTLLPVEIPCARILTFGYDANVVDLREMVSKNRIGDHASGLVTSLVIFREKDNTVRRHQALVLSKIDHIRVIARLYSWPTA